ncbi:hypothetical protein C8R46DRAFT_1346259 [Mycena filopes]|nr:hypothetical protein C8R46DRAFT_1346259 [Mycena filopes]
MQKSVAGVPQVPLEFFFKAVLPLVDDSYPTVHAELLKAGLIANGRWKSLDSLPALAKGHVEHQFAALVQVFNKIASVAETIYQRPPTALLIQSTGDEFNEAATAVPDVQIRLCTSEFASKSCFPTAVPWKLQRMRTHLQSNDHELIWSCQDVLRDDTCRRFTYGVTLDGTDLRIWFFSRSHELVSSSFSCTDVSTVLRLFLSLAFASPEQLGYDTTMSHFIDEAGNAQIRLKVAATVYVTKKLLSDAHSDAVCGRTTRVWEAYREDDPSRLSVAVKDLWTAADAIQEGLQLMELYDKINALPDPGMENPTRYFLTVLDHGFVQTSDGVDDHTVAVMARGSLPPIADPHSPRKHYRIVFKEVGTPIHGLKSLSEVMRALADATQALRLLYRLGLVHRDVSAGNILLVNGLGILSDLEFARPFKGPSSQRPGDCFIASPRFLDLTCSNLYHQGTANYTSGEVAAEFYSHVLETCKPLDAPSYTETPPFRFNPFHDVESTLWIGFWTILYHRRNDPAFGELFDRYFPPRSSDITLDRRMLAISCGFLSLDESDPLCPAMDILHDARRQLYKHYTAFEGDLVRKLALLDQEAPSAGSVFDDIHDIFTALYEKAASQCEGVLFAAPDAGRKRKASDDVVDPPPSPNDPVPGPNACATSPERPAKKSKSTSPKGPPTTRSSGSRKRRGTNVRPRRSARLAGQSKTASS